MTSEELDDLWDFKDAVASESAFRKLLDELSDADDRAEVSTQIACALGLQLRFDDANAELDAIEPDLGDRSPRVRVRYLLERGRILKASGDADGARTIFVQTWRAARGAGDDFYAIDAAHMLAKVEPPENQLRWYYRATELADESDEPRVRTWLGPLYNDAGWTYCESNHFKDALPMFEKALMRRREEGDARKIRLAEWAIARCLRSLAKIEDALAIQQRLVKECETAGEPDARVFEEMGECLLAIGREDDARTYFGKAYAMLEKDAWFADHEADRLARITRLANGVKQEHG
jgi:tetratricopeptide (TPR) repeat protein